MFSGLYDALNQRASAVIPDGSHSQTSALSPSGINSALSPSSPSGSTLSNTGDGAGISSSMGYTTYQRRPKPSLEDRLRASLAAKEQKRTSLEKEKSPLPALPVMDKRPDDSSQDTKVVDAASVPLPVSPPVHPTEPASSLQEMTGMVLTPSQSQAQPQAQPSTPMVSLPELHQIDSTSPTQPASLPLKLASPSVPVKAIIDPLSPQIYFTTTASTSVQELTLSSPISPAKESSDPLTPALMELEREQQAAAAKARSTRSPPPTTPSSQHTSPSKHHVTNRSISSNRPSIGDKDPFLRLESHVPESVRHPASLDQLLRGRSTGGLFEWLGIEGVEDVQELKEWAENMKKKVGVTQEEVNRLNGKLAQHDSRMEELRDTHRLESKSQSELIESLRQKIAETEARVASAEASLATERSLLSAERSTRESLIAAERAKHSTGLADVDTLKAKIKEMEGENEKLKGVAKEEEEKRTKAISLLKTVRTKLVKAEKDRDEAFAQLSTAKENEFAQGQKGEEELKAARAEVETLKTELEKVKSDSAKASERVREEAAWEVEKKRRELEAELRSMKDALERDALAKQGEWEIESIATKTAHQKEVANLNARIASLSSSLSLLTAEKGQLFTDLQLHQSEAESSRSELESLRAQVAENSYQLRERDEQLAMAQVELAEARRSTSSGTIKGSSSGNSGVEVARLLKEAESRSEARVAELRSRLKTIEAERAEQEENWSRTLTSRREEIERLQGLLSFQEKEGTKIEDYKASRDKEVAALEERISGIEKEKVEEKRKYRDLLGQMENLKENLEGKEHEISNLNSRLEAANASVDELKNKESQLKASNKTLREELRKVQSSAALLERHRNPGIGYWTSNTRSSLNGGTSIDSLGPASSSPDLSKFATGVSPATPTSANPASGAGRASSAGSARSSMEVSASAQGEEEVNLEYLRNVILQFLENEKMRPSLVRVISVILKFTPQETRRLVAKV